MELMLDRYGPQVRLYDRPMTSGGLDLILACLDHGNRIEIGQLKYAGVPAAKNGWPKELENKPRPKKYRGCLA